MADLPTIYILIIIAWAAFSIGFFLKQYAITAIASFFMIAVSVYIISQGLNGVNDWVTQGFGAIQIGIAAYALIRGGYELYKD